MDITHLLMEQEEGKSLYKDANFVFNEQHLMDMEKNNSWGQFREWIKSRHHA